MGTRKPKASSYLLVGMEPWQAAGPGWANSGITMLFEDRATGKVTRETIYGKDLPPAWFSVARTAYCELVKAGMAKIKRHRGAVWTRN